LCLCQSSGDLRDLHSFPTRRSSDLAIVIPAVDRANFDAVKDLAHGFAGGYYALGIHPIAVPDAQEEDLEALEVCIQAALEDERLDRKSTRLNSSHVKISYAVFCLKK